MELEQVKNLNVSILRMNVESKGSSRQITVSIVSDYIEVGAVFGGLWSSGYYSGCSGSALQWLKFASCCWWLQFFFFFFLWFCLGYPFWWQTFPTAMLSMGVVFITYRDCVLAYECYSFNSIFICFWFQVVQPSVCLVRLGCNMGFVCVVI